MAASGFRALSRMTQEKQEAQGVMGIHLHGKSMVRVIPFRTNFKKRGL